MRRSNHVHRTDNGIIDLPKVIKLGKILEYHLINNPDGVELPGRLGILKVVGFKPMSPILDMNETIKHKRAIYHTNEETDGFSFKVKWSRYKKGNRRVKQVPYRFAVVFKPGHRIQQGIIKKVRADPYFYNRTDVY